MDKRIFPIAACGVALLFWGLSPFSKEEVKAQRKPISPSQLEAALEKESQQTTSKYWFSKEQD